MSERLAEVLDGAHLVRYDGRDLVYAWNGSKTIKVVSTAGEQVGAKEFMEQPTREEAEQAIEDRIEEVTPDA